MPCNPMVPALVCKSLDGSPIERVRIDVAAIQQRRPARLARVGTNAAVCRLLAGCGSRARIGVLSAGRGVGTGPDCRGLEQSE